MDDRLAGEAAKLASQAQDLATNLKGVAQQMTRAAVNLPIEGEFPSLGGAPRWREASIFASPSEGTAVSLAICERAEAR